MKKIFLLITLFFTVISLNATDKPSHVVLKTNKGDITLQLFWDVAPKACENFTSLVRKGYYNGTIFHRIIKNFMIQGGDPTGTGMGGESIWGEPFEDEFKPNVVFDRPYILAMANRGRNTNGSQFFITLAPTPHLNGRHTIFGEVIKGKDVVRKIGAVTTNGDRGGNRPLFEQKIIKASIKEL